MIGHSRDTGVGIEPTFRQLFTPKIVTVLQEGYGLEKLRADAVAGLTVAIVALPLSMAIAIASGATPEQGIYTAIVGGFVVSLLGGSRFQIGGPAGAFIILVAATVQRHGMEGLILATGMSGLMLMAVGFLRLGSFIKFVPYPVTIGFTAGIAIIILASQFRELLGLVPGEPEPGPLLEKLPVLWEALPTVSPWASALAVGTIAIIVLTKRYAPKVPGMLVAVGVAAFSTGLLDLPVETIGTRFGGMSGSLPLPHIPAFTVEKAQAVLPDAIAFTLLGAIESLLSAVVADGMTGRRHRSNCELVAQGAANTASALFGGICVTGTIARTATNVRAGAHGPFAGMLHSAFLLVFLLVAAPLAAYIPLAALAGVLAVVAWNMVEKQAIVTLLKASRGDTLVLLTTFLLTIFRDLTEAIVVGFALGSVLFIHRMSRMAAVENRTPFLVDDQADSPRDGGFEARADDGEIVVYRISGAFFFGAAATLAAVLERIAAHHKVLILDFSAVPIIDTTGAKAIEGVAAKAERQGVRLILTGVAPDLRRTLTATGVDAPRASYKATIDDALQSVRANGTVD